ncbi:MAG: hypothetical protein SOY67_04400 [Collinsella sp.]|nr:hypothetical protein [Collinsella sp.]
MAKRVVVDIVRPGVVEVMKSDGVMTMLARQAAEAAARCNAMCSPSLRARGAEYASRVVIRDYLAGGLVYVSNSLAGVDNRRNNTLKKGCGA